jgi:hypothetical protein
VADTSGTQSNCPHDDTGLADWNDGATWGGSVPVGGDVTLPENKRVVIRQSVVQQLGLITIPVSSELIIGQNTAGITLDVTGMDVRGKLTAGSETCRIATPITITLHGSRPVDAVTSPPMATYKGISVHGGTLNLHGKRYYHTWSRLAKTAYPGDKVIMLQQTVNWQVGQEIVIVTAVIKDSRDFHQNEVRIIEAIDWNPTADVGAIVYLKDPLDYRHTANSNYQVEVGLLTRTLKIQGAADDSEPTDPDPANCWHPWAETEWSLYFESTQPCLDKQLTGFGGHMFVHSGGIGHVEGVELYRMGQTNVIGRYPMHFHLLNDCPTCYFRDSSVHRSYYRCISIHGTNYATISENVAYDVIGYCYYLEDGVEEQNTLSYNLAAHIHTLGPELPAATFGQNTNVYTESDTLTLPADVTASGFYITNVQNHIIGNAASGVRGNALCDELSFRYSQRTIFLTLCHVVLFEGLVRFCLS